MRFELGEVDPGLVGRGIAFLRDDPTLERGPGIVRRAAWTPDGPGTITLRWAAGHATATAQGPGGDWLLERADGLLGLRDDLTGFRPEARSVRLLAARFPGLRLVRTGTLWHDLAWAIVQQRIDVGSAGRQWRALCHRFGGAAPGAEGLWTPPDPDRIASAGYVDLHPCGIERQRSRHLIATARAIRHIDVTPATTPDSIATRVLAIPGVGPWTWGMARAVTFGDADVVVTGDVNLPRMVAFALAAERTADDDRMLELLAPYAGHRWRVVRLLFLGGSHTPGRRPFVRSLDIRQR